MKLEQIENELRKRHRYPYRWYRKQNNQWDSYTNFIYKTPLWEELVDKIQSISKSSNLEEEEVFQYAANRWYNFWSSQAVESIFCEIEGIKPAYNSKDKEKDFFLSGIPFDHKTSVYPKQFGKSFDYAQSHKSELIEWFYKNQSKQKRYHLKNRLFVVVYNENGAHWKLKAELSLLKNVIEEYVSTFKPEQLHTFSFGNENPKSDIIWVKANLP